MPGVSVRSRRSTRLGWVRELEQLEDRHDAEQAAEGREASHRHDRRGSARRDCCGPQLEHAGDVALAEQRERRDHHDVDDCDREPRLHEHLEAVAPANGDDPGEAPEEHVRGHLERAADRPGEERHDRKDDDRRAGVEQDRDEDPHGGGRQEERQDRAPGRDLERERRQQQQQPDQQQHVVAMPQLGPEPPDPREQEADEQRGQEEPAEQARRVQVGLVELERLDGLELELRDRLARVHDDLALAHAHRHRLDRGRCRVARLLGQLVAVRRVGHHERRDEVGRQSALVGRQPREDAPGQELALRRDVRVAELGPEHVLEDATGLVANRGASAQA